VADFQDSISDGKALVAAFGTIGQSTMAGRLAGLSEPQQHTAPALRKRSTKVVAILGTLWMRRQ